MTNIEFTKDGKFWVPLEEDHVSFDGRPSQHAHMQVQKVTGDYRFPGLLAGLLRTPVGLERLVVWSTSEDTRGMLHIFAPEQCDVVWPKPQ